MSPWDTMTATVTARILEASMVLRLEIPDRVTLTDDQAAACEEIRYFLVRALDAVIQARIQSGGASMVVEQARAQLIGMMQEARSIIASSPMPIPKALAARMQEASDLLEVATDLLSDPSSPTHWCVRCKATDQPMTIVGRDQAGARIWACNPCLISVLQEPHASDFD
ncbi:hypothetical protein ACBI99_44590 [Nonomuraea sp. ATR24]|uniref:hypothetical protein n=1 Tax=Nonomuraea sp. ATR24 TaxID=1676744 RepID=UPI0035BEBC92